MKGQPHLISIIIQLQAQLVKEGQKSMKGMRLIRKALI